MGKITREKEEYLIKFSDPNERLNKVCPACGSDKIVFLQYGFGWEPELQPLIDSGDVVPLGCVFGKHNLACRDCEHTFTSVENPDKL
jgi:hypothetical protein